MPLDLRLEAEGFAPHYAWDAALSAGKTLTLPPIGLRRGGSFAGWVTSEVEGTLLEEATVRLAPVDYAGAPQDVRLLSHTTRPNRRGFFQFTGVPPGAWLAIAEGKGLSPSKDVTISIDERGEATLRDALRLRRLAAIEVAIDPPVGPAGQPWQIRFHRRPAGSRFLAPAEINPSGAEGLWSREGIEAGEYVLIVADGTGTDYHRQPLVVEAGMPLVHVSIEAVRLAGRVLLGDEGVAAELKFRADGGENVTVRSDSEGEYQALMPFAGTWNVEAKLTNRRQSVTPKPVRVVRKDGEGTARADIQLSSGRIRGRVVNEAGVAVRAGVIVTRNGSPIADVMTEDGSFEVVGIEPGSVLVKATSASAQSAAVAVEANEHPLAVTLTLRKTWKLEGWLLSASGHPVAGASIRYWTPTPMFIGDQTTSPSGRFEVWTEAQPASITLAITAPGLPAKLMIVRAPRNGEPLEIVMRSQSARLIVAISGDIPPWPFIGHDGALAAMLYLLPSRNGRGGPYRSDGAVVLEVEPGDYSICDGRDAASTCVQQRLAPGATVHVRAPRPPQLEETTP